MEHGLKDIATSKGEVNRNDDIPIPATRSKSASGLGYA